MSKNKAFDKSSANKARSPRRKQGRKGRQANTAEDVTQPGHDNDWTWYAANPWLLKDAASIPFSDRAGTSIRLSETEQTGSSDQIEIDWKLDAAEAQTNSVQWVPSGVCGIACSTLPGVDKLGTSPINVASRNIQGYVVHANSRNLSYGAPNMMQYILAMDSFFGFYSHATRMYGLIRTYSIRNTNIPRLLFEACGWDYDDFANNMVDFRYWINTLSQKIGSLCIPGDMPFTKRHLWMYSKVFADSPTLKSRFYFYYPYDLYEYAPLGCPNDNLQDEFSSSQDTPGLRSHCISRQTAKYNSGAGIKFADLREIVEKCLSSLLIAEDFGVMSGDILKAFGADKVWRLSPIDADYYVVPEYLDHALWQIHNSFAIGYPNNAAGTGQTSDPYVDGLLYSSVKEIIAADGSSSWLTTPAATFATSAAFPFSRSDVDHVLNFQHDDPTPEDVIVATRMHPIIENTRVTVKVPGTGSTPTSVTVNSGSLKACGSEVIRAYVFVGNEWDEYPTTGQSIYGKMKTYVMQANCQYTSDTPTVAELQAGLQLLSRMSYYNWSPLFAVCTQKTAGKVAIYGLSYELNNYTIINSRVLRKMHETAVLSEFEVPLMGAWNNKLGPAMK